jgi:hypothetical protein
VQRQDRRSRSRLLRLLPDSNLFRQFLAEGEFNETQANLVFRVFRDSSDVSEISAGIDMTVQHIGEFESVPRVQFKETTRLLSTSYSRR